MKYFRDGEYELASDIFFELVDSDNNNHKAWNSLGVCLTKLEDYNQAAECFRNAVTLCPENQIYKKNLDGVEKKIPDVLPAYYEFKVFHELKRVIKKIRTDSTDFACLILSIFLLGLFIIAPLIGALKDSPARNIIGLCAALFFGFFMVSFFVRNLVLLGVRVKHLIMGIAVIAIVILPVFYLLNYPIVEYVQPMNSTANLDSYKSTIPLPMSNSGNGGASEYADGKNSISSSDEFIKNCSNPIADFRYQILDYDPYQISFYDTSDTLFSQISTSTWDFGDNTTSQEKKTIHTYAGSPRKYLVNLTVGNECGKVHSTQKYIDPNCSNLSPAMVEYPLIGNAPLQVTFTDISKPISQITLWRWIFGDGESFVTSDPSQRNVTHTYTQIGKYYASLIVENGCKQTFIATNVITVLGSGSISGNIWSDKNGDGIHNNDETNLTGWQVVLEELQGNEWVPYQIMNTDSTGDYWFSISHTGSTYRVRELLPDPGSWQIINGSNHILPNISESLPMYEQRVVYTVNFGNKEVKQERFHEVSLLTSRSGNISPGGKISWTQIENEGIATINGSTHPLKEGDICEISYLIPNNESSISIAGGMVISELPNVSFSVNQKIKSEGSCNQIIVPKMMNYDSTIQLTIEPEKSAYTYLLWDGMSIPINWKQKVILNALIPTGEQKMKLKIIPDQIFFSGRASSYELI